MKSLTLFAILAAGAGTLAACTNTDGSANRTATGGLAGAAAGAALGNLLSDGDQGATIAGGALGAALGAGIGNQLDRQARELAAEIGGSGATIVNAGDRLIVSLPEAITFATGSAEVRPDIRDEIASVSQSLQAYPDTTVQVIGHTDSTGTASSNQALSDRRAGAVGSILVASGTPSWRIQAYGVGFNQPVATNDTEAGRAANRRVEIVIRPTGGA